jgi:hypothetical protein
LPARRPDGGRKRRTREHIIADLAVNHVERQALLCGYTVERARYDYGIDLLVQTFDRGGEVEPGRINVQVKATERLKVIAEGGLVAFRIERADLRSWLEELMPVILVVYEARTEVAYWLYMQEFLRNHPEGFWDRGGERVTLHLPRQNVLDRTTFRLFARHKHAVVIREAGKAEYGYE